MRIVLFVRQYAPLIGGMETATRDVALELHQMGHHVTVITSNRSKATGQRLPDRETIAGIDVIRIGGWWRPLFIPRTRLATIPPADIMHVQGIDGLVWLAWRVSMRRHVPFLVTGHGAIFHTGHHPWGKRIMWATVFKALLTKASRLLSVSEVDRDHFARIGLTSDVIPMGFRLPVLSTPDGDRTIDLLYVGRIAEHKGLRDFFESVVALQRIHPQPLQVVVAGGDFDGTWDDLDGMARQLHIKYVGEVDEIEKWSLYERARVVVFPSRYEGFGIGVVEAMHAGALVAVSPLSHAAHIIRDSETGFHVPFHVPAQAAHLLKTLLAEPHMGVRHNARHQARYYEVSRYARELDEAYRDAVIRSPQSALSRIGSERPKETS